MSKSVELWRKLLRDQPLLKQAELILADLQGYRKTSLKRAEDIDTLISALSALQKAETER